MSEPGAGPPGRVAWCALRVAEIMGIESTGLVDIILLDAGRTPIGIYGIIRRVTSANVKEARARVNAAPGPIITGIARVQAEAIKVEIEALGAIVQLRETRRSAGGGAKETRTPDP
jgi:ribosomal protein L7/L12